MTARERHVLLALSTLLRYPDEGFQDDLSVLAQNKTLPPDIAAFCAKAAGMRVTSVQEAYLRTFEGSAARSLYLTWHRYGDDPSRGRALAALTELYTDAGFDPLAGELPDYVPAVLEFLAEAPDWACHVLLDGFAPQLRTLAERVAAEDTVYAPLMAVLATHIPEKTGEFPAPPPTRLPESCHPE